MKEYTAHELELMLIEVLQEVVDMSGYYGDAPELHDLLQGSTSVREFRLSKGIIYDHEKD